MKPTPICLNVSLHIDEKFGGLAASMPRFCEAVTSTGRFTSRLAALCESDEITPASLAPDAVHRFPAGRLRWATDRRLQRHLEELIRDSTIVHIHGIWREYSDIAARMCRKLGKPYLVSAHGMLEPWALADAKWKKRAYLSAIELPMLRGAVGLRALTSSETADYQNISLRNPIQVIPNGVDIPEPVSPQIFLDAFPHLAGQRLVLFLGRIHPKKGIDILCRAWASLEESLPDAHLVIAGPDDGDLIHKLSIKGHVTFTGMLRGPLKASALAASTLFVLPSHSEGFSVSVLEALGSGLPVLISHNCHFPEVTEAGCGWEIAPEEEQIRTALALALALDPKVLADMAGKGKNLVAARYTWSAIGTRTADMLEDWAGLSNTHATNRS